MEKWRNGNLKKKNYDKLRKIYDLEQNGGIDQRNEKSKKEKLQQTEKDF